MAKGSRPLPLPGLRGGAATWPKRGHTTHWPLTGHLLAKGLRPPPPPTGQRRGTATLRGATPSPASHWPLATPHRERGTPLGAAPLREPHPLTGHLPPDRRPTGEVGLWPKAIAHPASYWPKDRQLATFGHRLPHWPEKRTAPHRGATPTPLATYWPSGRPPLATKGREGDAFARPSPDWPPKGA